MQIITKNCSIFNHDIKILTLIKIDLKLHLGTVVANLDALTSKNLRRLIDKLAIIPNQFDQDCSQSLNIGAL